MRRIRAEWPGGGSPRVVATGGLAAVVAPLTTSIEHVAPRPDSPGPAHRRQAPRAHLVSRAREAGYRLLGSRLDYLLHLRPGRMAHHGGAHRRGLSARGRACTAPRRASGSGRRSLGLALWVACLNGGTLALNSAFDRDEGDIAYLRNPPPPPRRLAAFALALMVAGQLASPSPCPPDFRLAYAVCFVLSVLYSVPPFRLKAVAGADWLINMVGLRHAHAVRRLGGDRAAPGAARRDRAARVLSAVRGALSAHPALPARGGRPPGRPYARAACSASAGASTPHWPPSPWRSRSSPGPAGRSEWDGTGRVWRWAALGIALARLARRAAALAGRGAGLSPGRPPARDVPRPRPPGP